MLTVSRSLGRDAAGTLPCSTSPPGDQHAAPALTFAAAAMIALTVRRQRPQSAPAPHASATSLEVHAPPATTSATTCLVAPVHRHTNISAFIPPAAARHR
jgi:MYXO-CTERM domain-containing protein